MSRTKGRPDKTSPPKAKMDAKAQALAPDLEAIRRFIVQMIARGAIAEMIASVLLAATLNGMDEVYAALRMHEPAVAHFEMAVTASIEGQSNAILLNVSLNLGNLYVARKEWAQAAEFYVGAEALTTAFLDASTKLACLENIGVCRVELQDYAAAQQAWTTGAGLATTLGDHRLCRRMF